MWLDASFIGILICVFSAIPVCILAALMWRAHRSGKRLRAVVLGLAFVHELVLVTYPGWYDAITEFRAETDLHLAPGQLLIVYFGEMLFVLLFAATLAMNSYRGKLGIKSHHGAETCRPIERDRIFLTLLVVSALGLYAGQFLMPTINGDALASHYQFKDYGGLSGVLADWGGTLVRWPGLFAAGFVLTDRRRGWPIRLLSSLVLVAEMIYSMINGMRGGIIWVISVVALVGYFKSSKKLLIAASAVTIACAPLMSWMHTNMRYVTLAAPLGTLNWQMIPELVQGAVEHKVLESTSVGSNFLESWSLRAIGPLDSIYLYKFYDEGNGASYKPIVGTLFLPIPRAIWPGKPVAGSTDDSNLGMAIYKVQQQKPDSAFYDMGPILASAHAYWEGGWSFLFIAAVFTGWFWSRLLAWGERAQSAAVDIVILSFTAALPIDGFFDMLNPLFTYFRLLWITLLPMLCVLWVLDAWLQRRKPVRDPGHNMVPA